MLLQSVALKLTHLMFQVAEIIDRHSNKQGKAAAQHVFSSCTLLSILAADTDYFL